MSREATARTALNQEPPGLEHDRMTHELPEPAQLFEGTPIAYLQADEAPVPASLMRINISHDIAFEQRK